MIKKMAKMKTPAAIVNRQASFRLIRRNSGVALLQVLLITAIISLLAIRFTQSAQDQLSIAFMFENRVQAQLRAHSAMNEVIFSQLVTHIESVSDGEWPEMDLSQNSSKIKLWGEVVDWGDDISVSVQDLNGLAPQRYPEHLIWEQVLSKSNLPQEEIDQILGVWQDIQDPDSRSWVFGDREPAEFKPGKPYLNGYAQSDMVLRWIFEDRPGLRDFLLDVSSIHSPMKTNLFHAPSALLEYLFDADVYEQLTTARQQDAQSWSSAISLLPEAYAREYIGPYHSSMRIITVTVGGGQSTWRIKAVISILPRAKSPFRVISVT